MINNEITIPKKIHFCWLSDEPLPNHLIQCMDSWRRILPDYEIVKWDMKKFDINSQIFVKEACSVKKWAFAADYIRLFALYNEGGIYLDTDVYVRKSFDDFLQFGFFTSFEYEYEVIDRENSFCLIENDGTSKKPGTVIPGIQLQAAILGAKKGHPFLKECMSFYHEKHFILEDGSFFNKIIAPYIYMMTAEKFGIIYHNQNQLLINNMMIFSSEKFGRSLHHSTKEAYAIHLCNGGWRDKRNRGFFNELYIRLSENIYIRKLLKKTPIFYNVMNYTLPKEGLVVFKIKTILGYQIDEVSVGMLTSKKQTFNWKFYDLPNGKYICQIFLEDKIIHEMFVVKR